MPPTKLPTFRGSAAPKIEDRARVTRATENRQAGAQKLVAAARHHDQSAIAIAGQGDSLSDADWKALSTHLALAERFQHHADRLSQVTVRSEPRVYGPNSGNSYVRDQIVAATPLHQDHRSALARLARYDVEIVHEIARGSAEGQRALRAANTVSRGRDAHEAREVRAGMTSGATSGGSFVVPIFDTEDAGIYRSYSPSFLKQARQIEDPGYGLQFKLPVWDSVVAVAQQVTENSAITVSSPTSSSRTVSMVTFTGGVAVSQQFLDRAGPTAGDKQILRALQDSLDQQVNAYVIARALATAGTVAGTATYSAKSFAQDVAKAKAAAATTAGTKLMTTHLFLNSEFGDWAMAQSDTAGRPIFTPANSQAVYPVASPATGFVGATFLNLAVFQDGSIPNTGVSTVDTQIVVANPNEVFVVMSEPAFQVTPETYAQDLQAFVSLRCYVGVVVRHPKAVQVLSSAAYPAAPTYA